MTSRTRSPGSIEACGRQLAPTTQPGRPHFRNEEPGEVVGVPASLETLAVDTEARLSILAQQVKGDMVQNRRDPLL